MTHWNWTMDMNKVNRYNWIKPITTLLGCFLLLMTSMAQVDSLPAEQVEVLKEFNAKIASVKKRGISTQLPAPDNSPITHEYQVSIQQLSLDYPPPTIRPLAMKPDTPEEYYDGHAAFGLGNLNSIYGALDYQHHVDRYYDIGLHFDHFSANGNEIIGQEMSNQNGLVDIAYYINEKWKTELDFGIKRDLRYKYFQNSLNEPISEADRRERFLYEVGLDLSNAAESNIHKSINVSSNFYRLNLKNENTSETRVELLFEGKAELAQHLHLHVHFGGDLLKYNTPINNHEYKEIFILPKVEYGKSNWSMVMGAGIYKSDEDTFIYPDLRINYQLRSPELTLFLGTDGEYTLHSFRTFVEYSPYVFNDLIELQYQKSYDFYSGLNGRVGDLNMEVKGGYSITDNVALFQSADTYFLPIYDDANITFFELFTGVDLRENIEVGISLRKEFYSFETDTNEKPWNVPTLQGRVFSIIKLLDNAIEINPEIIFQNKVTSIDPLFNVLDDQLNSLIELNLNVHYQPIKHIGLFVSANNLLNRKYVRWRGYEGFGLNVFGGVTARF